MLYNVDLVRIAVGNNLFLGFWTGGTIDGFSQGQYMAVYAGLGTEGGCM